MTECTPCNPSKENKPTSRVTVSKAEAEKMTVGSSVSLHMTGTVRDIQQSYDNKEMYEVVIEEPSVEVKSDEKKDENMATMPREKLKEKIQKPSDEE